MRNLLLYFFIGLWTCTIHGNSTSTPQRQKELLAYVKKAPKSSNLDLITRYLSHEPKNEMEIAETIFLWLSQNIVYDVANFQKGKFLKQDPTTTLKNKKAVCGGFSNLYKAMADKMNLSARVVSGYSKGYGYYLGKKFTNTDHAWNIVTINGKEILIDATWGSGSARKKWGKLKYIKQINYYWFHTKPSEFVFSHLPEVNKAHNQLLEKPISLNEYEKLPRIRSSFFKNRIANSDKILMEFREGVTHNLPIVYDIDIEFAVIKAPLEMNEKEQGLYQFYTLKGEKMAIIHNKEFLHFFDKGANNYFRFIFAPSKKGKYTIGVLYDQPKGKKQSYISVMQYEVQ